MRPLRILVLSMLLTLAGVAAAQARTVVFLMFPSALDQPRSIAFQASSGPSLQGLTWSGWGSARAVGTGEWVLDCSSGGASCGSRTDVQRLPARWRLSGLRACPGEGGRVTTYVRGVVEIDRPEGTRTTRFDPDADFCAKRPTLAEARIAVRRAIRPARVRSLDCGVFDRDSIECHVRFGKRGKARYLVFGRLGKAPRASRVPVD